VALIKVLECPPLETQADVYAFVDFLAQRRAGAESVVSVGYASASFPAHPYQVGTFTPLTREERNAR